MGGFSIRSAEPADAGGILLLHQAVASVPGGIARRPHEVTPAYVAHVMAEAADGGLNLVAVDAEGGICGEIHALRMKLDLFAHVLTDLTVAVHPDWQGRGVGSGLFEALIAAARALTPAIGRIELWTGAGNLGAQRLYQRLGFKIEGRMVGRGRLPDGRPDDDIVMGLLL
jgi:GNAT superfamily N-acetyltransferase